MCDIVSETCATLTIVHTIEICYSRPSAATVKRAKFTARLLLGHTTQKQTVDYIRNLQGISAEAIEKIVDTGENKA